MEYNKDKVDEMVLALLYLTSTHDALGARAWKGLDLETLNRLYEKGYIDYPKVKTPTLDLTETGEKLSRELFIKYFGIEDETN